MKVNAYARVPGVLKHSVNRCSSCTESSTSSYIRGSDTSSVFILLPSTITSTSEFPLWGGANTILAPAASKQTAILAPASSASLNSSAICHRPLRFDRHRRLATRRAQVKLRSGSQADCAGTVGIPNRLHRVGKLQAWIQIV